MVFQSLHDGIVLWDAVLVRSCLEPFDEYHIGFVVLRHHDVLVSTLSKDGEATTVVRVQCCYCKLKNVEFIVGIAGHQHGRWRRFLQMLHDLRWGLCQLQALACLCNVT